MVRCLKIIVFLALAMALGDIVCDAFVGVEPMKGDGVSDVRQHVAIYHQNLPQDEMCFNIPALPYLPDGELASIAGYTQLLIFSRIHRFYLSEYLFSLRDWVVQLARREEALSLHWEKLFDAVACCRCLPACEYYIFTLRRIVI